MKPGHLRTPLTRFGILIAISSISLASQRARTPAVSSPSGDRSAYVAYELSGGRTLHLVVTGKAPLQASIMPQHRLGENCWPTSLDWLDKTRIAIHCEYDPHLDDYLIVNSQTGKVEHEYGGVWFGWSPDRQTLAHFGVLQLYTAPEGDNCCLLFNSATVYPFGCHFDGEQRVPGSNRTRPLASIHTFFPPLVWSSDGLKLAFLEKVYNWHYGDPYNRDFYGRASEVRYYLAIITAGRPAVGYSVPDPKGNLKIAWINDSAVEAAGRRYDLSSNTPYAIP
jgi:hypothetical protein